MFIGTKLGIYASVEAASAFTNVYSLAFDGVDDRLNVGANDSLALDTSAGVQEISFSCWFKSSAGAGAVNLWWNDNYYAPYWSYSTIDMNSSGEFLLQLQKNTWGKLTVTNAGWNDGDWHHFVYTWDAQGPLIGQVSAGSTFYIDGSVEAHIATGAIASPVIPEGETRFFRTYSSHPMLGDEISIWTKELTSAEVTEIYNSGTPTDLSSHSAVADLEAWWRNGDPTGTGAYPTIVDASGNGFDATMVNMDSGDIQTDIP